MRGATARAKRKKDEAVRFQSTHPCGVRHLVIRTREMALMFQSTHPCGVRRQQIGAIRSALLRFNPRTRAGCDTCQELLFGHPVHVSIHAPVRGATRFDGGRTAPHTRFNPRTRAGCDSREAITAWEGKGFQSTHPCGVRQEVDAGGGGVGDVSIHAPVRGATRQARRVGSCRFCFNPRTRAGCDSSCKLL